MKRFVLILCALSMALALAGQKNIDDMLWGPDSPKDTQTQEQAVQNKNDDLIKINFQKKNARLAMVYSTLLPGAGQFYADKTAISTWIFPAIELAMIGGIVYFNYRGDKKTDDFEKYATGETISQTFNYTVQGVDYSYTYTGPRYNRNFQRSTQDVLIGFYPQDIYDLTFFRLDSSNTQHFYEDIGKYNKYVFGWADWYYRFATDPRTGDYVLNLDDYKNVWVWTDTQYEYSRRWTSNIRVEDFLNGITDQGIAPGTSIASPLRQEYIQMRKNSNTEYSYARLFTLGLAFNHIASAIDAVILTNKVNKTYITQDKLKLNYYASVKDGVVQPNLGLSWKF